MSTIAAHRYDTVVSDPHFAVTLLFSLLGLMLSLALLASDPDALIALGAY
jgi:hypothetical protein